MHYYITIPKLDNNPVYSYAIFAARYLELTGENVQDSKPETVNGLLYFGSNKLTPEIMATLKTEFPMIRIENDFNQLRVGLKNADE